MFKENLKRAELIERIHWLILLRWVAISGLFFTTYVFSSIFTVVEQVIPLYTIGVIIGLTNLGFYYNTNALRLKPFASVQMHAGIQIMTDHFFLICLIYFAGGIENPFIFYFLFHAIIGGIFLEKKYSYLQALFATSLFALLLLLEYYSVVPHQPLQTFSAFKYSDELWHSEVYILCVFFALASTIFISVYFVTSIMDRLRKSRDDVLFEIKSTLENMAEGVIFIDPDDKVTMCNREIEKAWKVQREEILNKSVKDDPIPYIGEVASKITERFRKGIETSQHQEIKTEDGFLYNTYSAVFDTSGKTWRHECFPEYKFGRVPMDDCLWAALPDFAKLFRFNGIAALRLNGWEADDLIATLAVKAAQQNIKSFIVSTDKGFTQLLHDPLILQYDCFAKLGFDATWVEGKYGVAAEQLQDYWALVGDTTNRIPGVKGIGPKTALRILQQASTIEAIYEDMSIFTDKQQALLEGGLEQCLLSRKLVALKTDVDIGVRLSQLAFPRKPSANA